MFLAFQNDSVSSAFGWMFLFFLFGVGLYVYFSLTLMMIARKSNTPNAGLAWIPILHLVLMCQIARRPGWWILLLFIPLVNLIVFTMLWMSIAEARGHSALTGALAIVPVVGWFVPALLAFGEPTNPDGGAARACLNCSAQIVASEQFCRHCGHPAPVGAARPNRMPAGQMALIGAGAAVFVCVAFGVVGWFMFASALAYTPPERKAPEIPERTAGTLTEFPVDTDPNAPLAPESVVTEDLQAGSSGTTATNQTTAKRLPPGVNRETLRRRGTTATTVVYRPRPKADQKPGVPMPDIQIYICVIRLIPGQAGQADLIAAEIVKATGGARTGARVNSPRGSVYVGSRVRTGQISVHVLEKQGSDIVILVYAPTPAAHDAAARLAGNVGNGEGLNDYKETRTSIWTLPQRPPADLTLVDFSTWSRNEVGLSANDLKTDDAEAQKLIDYFSQFIPERGTQARYRDSARREWEVMIYEYETPRRAWNTWFFLSWTLGLSGQSVTTRHGDGLYADTGDGGALIFQKGPYLIAVTAPKNTTADRLIAFGNVFQV